MTDIGGHGQAEREAVMAAVAESFGACNNITADRVLDALAEVRVTDHGRMSIRWPQEYEIVDRGTENGREYVVTQCASMGEPTSYGSRHIEAFYDRKMRKARLRIKHYRAAAVGESGTQS